MTKFQIQIDNYVSAATPLIYCLTREDGRLTHDLGFIRDKNCNTTPPQKYELYVWSATQGLGKPKLYDSDPKVSWIDADPVKVWDVIANIPEPSVVVLLDYHLIIENPPCMPIALVRSIKNASQEYKNTHKTVIISGSRMVLPSELEKEFVMTEHKLPERDDFDQMIDNAFKQIGKSPNGDREDLKNALAGLTMQEGEQAIYLAAVESGKKDIPASIVAREKAATIKKGGILEVWEDVVTMGVIGGLSRAKEWLLKRKKAFTKEAREYGLPLPKGVLFVGPSGTGKSLCAKAVSSALNVPLMRMDIGKLFAKHVGESEENARAAIAQAEAIAPCVLWWEEIDKSFSGIRSSDSTDGGTTARVFSFLLTWMQEKKTPVFVVATANDVSNLPPEMLRKGRWDCVFCVNFPTAEERSEIWKIHITNKKRSPKKFNIDQLVKATAGWSGAEIEQVMVESLYHAFYEDCEPDTKMILKLCEAVTPLSRSQKSEVDKLMSWASSNATPASDGGSDAKIQDGRTLN